jgi:hypothetical protein
MVRVKTFTELGQFGSIRKKKADPLEKAARDIIIM